MTIMSTHTVVDAQSHLPSLIERAWTFDDKMAVNARMLGVSVV
jgi:hypothetical protein